MSKNFLPSNLQETHAAAVTKFSSRTVIEHGRATTAAKLQVDLHAICSMA